MSMKQLSLFLVLAAMSSMTMADDAFTNATNNCVFKSQMTISDFGTCLTAAYPNLNSDLANGFGANLTGQIKVFVQTQLASVKATLGDAVDQTAATCFQSQVLPFYLSLDEELGLTTDDQVAANCFGDKGPTVLANVMAGLATEKQALSQTIEDFYQANQASLS